MRIDITYSVGDLMKSYTVEDNDTPAEEVKLTSSEPVRVMGVIEDEAAHWKQSYEEQTARCERLENANVELSVKLATAETEYNNMRDLKEEWRNACHEVQKEANDAKKAFNETNARYENVSGGYDKLAASLEECVRQRNVLQAEFDEVDAHRVELENACRDQIKWLEYYRNVIDDMRVIFGQINNEYKALNSRAQSAMNVLPALTKPRIRPAPAPAYSVMGDNDGPYPR